mmetsp:Transcript_8912/g.9640  ORF Transcript_8912/g.9640 Transcript_8912/m.9640 type:complete len:131 (-) Transcript_8912:154-546(-)
MSRRESHTTAGGRFKPDPEGIDAEEGTEVDMTDNLRANEFKFQHQSKMYDSLAQSPAFNLQKMRRDSEKSFGGTSTNSYDAIEKMYSDIDKFDRRIDTVSNSDRTSTLTPNNIQVGDVANLYGTSSFYRR